MKDCCNSFLSVVRNICNKIQVRFTSYERVKMTFSYANVNINDLKNFPTPKETLLSLRTMVLNRSLHDPHSTLLRVHTISLLRFTCNELDIILQYRKYFKNFNTIPNGILL